MQPYTSLAAKDVVGCVNELEVVLQSRSFICDVSGLNEFKAYTFCEASTILA